MKTKNPPLIALTLAAALSASAADFSIEGRLLQSEAVQASVEAAVNDLRVSAKLIDTTVIPNPDAKLWEALV